MTKEQQQIILRTIRAELRNFKHNPNDSDDLQSEAWVRILTAWPRYDTSKGKLNTWAASQARGAFMDYRRSNYAPRLKDRDKSKRHMNHHLEHMATPATIDLELIDFNNIRCAISDKEAHIMRLWLEGHALHQIADMYGVHESRISQIFTALKQRMRDAAADPETKGS